MKKKVLLWLPVILLPASNLIPMLSGHPHAPFLLFPVIGAVIEEFVFRGLLLGKWLLRERRIQPVAAILIAGAAFSLMHLWNLRTRTAFSEVGTQMLFAFCFSIWAGAVVWRTGRIRFPFIAHVLLNATAGDAQVVWVSLLLSAIVLIDGILLMRSASSANTSWPSMPGS